MGQDNYLDALPLNHRLHWYVLERVLGQGGFGITYLARDSNLAKAVAIKEYLPVDVAVRDADGMVKPRTEAYGERYGWGLDRFIEEARTLARFDHPNIVRVHSVFEANGTAYMVMRFEEGENLASLLERRGVLPEPELQRVLLPILDGLEAIHREGFIHRDIKPENIHVRRDGSPVLLDFGSARQSIGHAKTMTVLIAPGYAPIEQYYGEASAQGPWTDIYGLGATCYRAIAGEAPRDAIARTKGILGSSRETMTPAVSVGRGRYSPQLLAAVDHALQLNEGDRPQTVGAWRRELLDEAAAHGAATPAAHAIAATSNPRSPWMMRIAVATTLALVGAIGLWLWLGREQPAHVDATAQSSDTAAPTSIAAATAATEPEVPIDTSEAGAAAATDANTGPAALPEPVQPSRPVPTMPLATDAAPPRREESTRKPAATTQSAQPAPVRPTDTPVAAANSSSSKPRDSIATNNTRTTPVTAESGDPGAQMIRGAAKENGRGVPQSLFEAYVWYSLAARQGYPGAEAMRQRVAARLQDAEIRQADHVVERWRPQSTDTTTATGKESQ